MNSSKKNMLVYLFLDKPGFFSHKSYIGNNKWLRLKIFHCYIQNIFFPRTHRMIGQLCILILKETRKWTKYRRTSLIRVGDQKQHSHLQRSEKKHKLTENTTTQQGQSGNRVLSSFAPKKHPRRASSAISCNASWVIYWTCNGFQKRSTESLPLICKALFSSLNAFCFFCLLIGILELLQRSTETSKSPDFA